MITLSFPKTQFLLSQAEIEVIESQPIGMVAITEDYSELHRKILIIVVSSDLNYFLDEHLMKMCILATEKRWLELESMFNLITKAVNGKLKQRSRELSGHEVSHRNHILLNASSKPFSVDLRRYGSSICREDFTTYDELATEIMGKVDQSFKGQNINIECE